MNRCKLGDIFSIKQGFAFKTENYVDSSEYRLITLGNFTSDNEFKYNDEKATYYGAEFPDDVILQKGDLIIPLTEQTEGLFGNSAFIPETNGDYVFVLNQRVGKILLKDEDTDKTYLHYLLATSNVRKQIEARANGTQQRNVSPENIYDVIVDVIDIEDQKKVGKLLFDIEKKRNINNKINSELEAIAKEIYDYRFIQFDFPDENGKPYKSSGGKMVGNEELKREIPEGWEVKKMLTVLDWVTNSQPPKSEFSYTKKEGYIRFIQNRDYSSDDHITYVPFSKGMSVCSDTDILIDKYGDAGRVRFGIEGVFNVALAMLKPHNENYLEYIRGYFETDGIYKYLHESCMASTRASLSEENLKHMYIVVPSEDIVKKYNAIVSKITRKRLQLNLENKKLSELRDFLLPMLMNGQVTVK